MLIETMCSCYNSKKKKRKERVYLTKKKKCDFFFCRWTHPRELCLLRYWRREDDGSYLIILASSDHRNSPQSPGYVRAQLFGIYFPLIYFFWGNFLISASSGNRTIFFFFSFLLLRLFMHNFFSHYKKK